MAEKVSLNVQGMHCGSCAMAIEMVLKDKKGVSKIKVDYDKKKADVEFDPKQVNLNDIIGEIKKIGFNASK